jgi:hypothetical protein
MKRLVVFHNGKTKYSGKFYVDQNNILWIDGDPDGVDMSGKRIIYHAPKEYTYLWECEDE